MDPSADDLIDGGIESSLPAGLQSVQTTLAPAWHTLVLMAGILALSVQGAMRMPASHGAPSRLTTYALTALLELCLLAWVAFGLRLAKTPLRSLFGSVPAGLRAIRQDLGVAFVFWIGSLMILGSFGVLWSRVDAAVTHRATQIRDGRPFATDPSQQQAVRVMVQLAPENGVEIAAWVLLCVLAGLAEELVFRGYLQRQFTAWAGGARAVGVVISSLAFGAAHGYQGVRNMVLLAVFGVLFSLLAIFRGSLRAGIFAHSWHDLIAGLTVALLHSRHLL